LIAVLYQGVGEKEEERTLSKTSPKLRRGKKGGAGVLRRGRKGKGESDAAQEETTRKKRHDALLSYYIRQARVLGKEGRLVGEIATSRRSSLTAPQRGGGKGLLQSIVKDGDRGGTFYSKRALRGLEEERRVMRPAPTGWGEPVEKRGLGNRASGTILPLGGGGGQKEVERYMRLMRRKRGEKEK